MIPVVVRGQQAMGFFSGFGYALDPLKITVQRCAPGEEFIEGQGCTVVETPKTTCPPGTFPSAGGGCSEIVRLPEGGVEIVRLPEVQRGVPVWAWVLLGALAVGAVAWRYA